MSNKAPSWIREKRARAQARDVEAKTTRETDYFWELQEQNKRYDVERGGPPRKGRKRLDEEEYELFTTKEGMAAGIDFDHYDEIAVQINGKGHESIHICETFEDIGATFGLPTWLQSNIWKCHYKRPTPVQKYAVPTGLTKHDMMVCAQTGSGKTCAFLCPIALALQADMGCEAKYETWSGPAAPLALVLAPTRELCTQIFDEARKLFHRGPFKISQCYGGVEAKLQLRDMSRGCDVLIATPGRLIDFIDRGVLSMWQINFLCLDEADRMLDMGFEPQIRQIVEQRDMTDKWNRQTMMFSATFPREIQRLAGSFLKDEYIWISVGRVGAAADTVTQNFIPIEENQSFGKLNPLMNELDNIDLQNEKVLIFVGMKRTASWLCGDLYRKRRYPTTEIHGDLSQAERERALQQFKSGERPIMVATEVAARGLDIPKVTKVINFDMPTQIDDYVHRIGRTGRVGNLGTAISFFRCRNCDHADTDLAPELCQLLEDAKRDVPDWLAEEARSSKNRNKWTGSSGGRGNNNFGHSDWRGGGKTHRIQGKGKGKGGKSGGGKSYGGGGYGGGKNQNHGGGFGGSWRDNNRDNHHHQSHNDHHGNGFGSNSDNWRS